MYQNHTMIRLHHLFDSALHMSSRVHFDSISITIPRNPEETLIAGKVMGVGSKQKPPTEMLQRFHRLPSREVTYPLPAGTFKPMIFLFPFGGICLLILEMFFSKNPATFFCCWCFRGAGCVYSKVLRCTKTIGPKADSPIVTGPEAIDGDGGWIRLNSPRSNKETSHIHTGQLRHFRVWWRL